MWFYRWQKAQCKNVLKFQKKIPRFFLFSMTPPYIVLFCIPCNGYPMTRCNCWRLQCRCRLWSWRHLWGCWFLFGGCLSWLGWWMCCSLSKNREKRALGQKFTTGTNSIGNQVKVLLRPRNSFVSWLSNTVFTLIQFLIEVKLVLIWKITEPIAGFLLR